MLSGLFAKKEKKEINWIPLTAVSTLDEIDQKSKTQPILIFKHSTRCSISSMTLNRFENACEDSPSFDLYFLDLIANRAVSNEVAIHYGVEHQSPQAILVVDGKAVYDASHTAIDYHELTKRTKTHQ